MTKSERRLLAKVARAVITIARNTGNEQTAKDLEESYTETGVTVGYEAAQEEFAPAIAVLERVGISTDLQHTGGGIYVLYYRWEDNPDGPHVGITPDETDPNGERWLVVGYRDNQDEGSWVKRRVVDANLSGTIVDARRAVVQPTLSDEEALHRLVNFVRTPEWSVSMLEDIAEIVRKARPNIGPEFETDDPRAWQQH